MQVGDPTSTQLCPSRGNRKKSSGVGNDEIPVLTWQALFLRIVVHILNSPADFVGHVQKHLITAVRPDRMSLRNRIRLLERKSSRPGKIRPDYLRPISMRPRYHVNVIRADGQRSHRVAVHDCRITERVRDDDALPFIEPNQWIVDTFLRVPRECLNVLSRRLRHLPSRKDLSQCAEILISQFGRSAASQIVWEPMAVSGENQMRRENRTTRRILTSAKGQARDRARRVGTVLLRHSGDCIDAPDWTPCGCQNHVPGSRKSTGYPTKCFKKLGVTRTDGLTRPPKKAPVEPARLE